MASSMSLFWNGNKNVFLRREYLLVQAIYIEIFWSLLHAIVRCYPGTSWEREITGLRTDTYTRTSGMIWRKRTLFLTRRPPLCYPRQWLWFKGEHFLADIKKTNLWLPFNSEEFPDVVTHRGNIPMTLLWRKPFCLRSPTFGCQLKGYRTIHTGVH